MDDKDIEGSNSERVRDIFDRAIENNQKVAFESNELDEVVDEEETHRR